VKVSGWPGLELEVVDVRLRDQVERLALHELLVGVLHQRLDGLLADLGGEPLAHHARGRLARAEPGQARLRGVAARGALFGGGDGVRRDRHVEVPLHAGGVLRGDRDVHAEKCGREGTAEPNRPTRGWAARPPAPRRRYVPRHVDAPRRGGPRRPPRPRRRARRPGGRPVPAPPPPQPPPPQLPWLQTVSINPAGIVGGIFSAEYEVALPSPGFTVAAGGTIISDAFLVDRNQRWASGRVMYYPAGGLAPRLRHRRRPRRPQRLARGRRRRSPPCAAATAG
jgi:hypothetical protein